MSTLTADRHFILDMDGVLYRGDRSADGLRELFELLAPERFVCVTNNSLHGAAELAAKLAGMGVQIPLDRFVPVAEAVRAHLAATAAPGTPTFVIGAGPLRAAVAASGADVVTHDRAAIVVLGLDLDLRFSQLATATLALRAGARLVATSSDPILLTEDGAVPGTGAFVALLRACSDVTPELVGKPHPPMFHRALELLGCSAEDAVVVGDSATADVAGGRGIGATTVLLTSGVTAVETHPDHGADHTMRDLRELVDHLKATS